MKVCFLGLGSIGTRHLRNLKDLYHDRPKDLTVHALRHNISPLESTVAKLIDKQLYSPGELDPDYDIAFITNPTASHYESIVSMSSISQHMFIEKPLFESKDRSPSSIFMKPGSVYYVAAPLRYSEIFQEMKRRLEGETVYSARALCSSYLPDWRKGVDYRKNYSAHQSMGGGVALDLIHEWDYLVHLFGFPNKVYQMAGKYSHLEINSEDLAVYIAEYPKRLVEVHLDYLGRTPRRELELFTAKGTWIADFIKKQIRGGDGEVLFQGNVEDDIYKPEIASFMKMIRHEVPNDNDIHHAYKVLKLALGA